MYTGFWCNNRDYNHGDIVITQLNDYFICIKNHFSNNLTFPTKEDIYWVYISSTFLNMLIEQNVYNETHNIYDVHDVQETQETRNVHDVHDVHDVQDKINLKRKINSDLDYFSRDFKKQKIDTDTDTVKVDTVKVDTVNNIQDIIIKNLLKQNKKFKMIVKDKLEIIREKCNESDNSEKSVFKRKLETLENEIVENKRIKLHNNVDNLRDKILLMNIDIDTKTFILDKHDNIQKMNGSDYTKGINWLKSVSNIPYGVNKSLNITKDDSSEKIKEYFKDIKDKLDESIYGLEEVKQEILEFVARKISNPESKGHVLALYGEAGVGKSKILKTLSQALNLPFYQINFGGLNDVSILTGHSETYIGSKPGKIVEILQKSNCMNPIIYFDEIDKVSENKAVEIYGILTHLLDEEQNSHFQDNYLSNINIDLSKVFFVLAFNDITKIDKIVCDRLKVIYIDPPNLEDKITICSEKMIPEILNNVKIKNDLNIIIDKQVIEYIIVNKTQKEKGVRQLRKNIEKIANRVNYDILVQNYTNFKYENEKDLVITRSYIDHVLVSSDTNKDYLQMYI
jgi:ATP-dependent Lon protease